MGCNVGGEQSGHIVLTDFNTTGDGLVAALQILSILIEKNKMASVVFNSFEAYPQYLENVRYSEGQNPLKNKNVIEAISDGERLLNTLGRVLVRKSGTEPLIRVMAEGPDANVVNSVAKDIVSAIQASIIRV